MNDTSQSYDRQDRNARLIGYACALLVALACIWARFAPAAPQQPLYYRPDPTPFVVETTHVEVFSHNCIGWNVNC